jgi:Glu-tRNA(Gln) amidotransferase subunit E-like FAD-binding protein
MKRTDPIFQDVPQEIIRDTAGKVLAEVFTLPKSQTDKSLRPVTIKRMNEDELNRAIKDLEKRGYELIKQGKTSIDRMELKYRQSSRVPYKFAGKTHDVQCWAVLKKKEVLI